MKYRYLTLSAICVLLAALLLAGCGKTEEPETIPVETTEETIPAPTAPADGNPDDVTCKGSYTVDEAALSKAAGTVVAQVGEQTLTVEQLQLYYWLEVADFRQSGAEGPDFSQSLDTQLCDLDETAITWQQYFLQRALDTWHAHQALVLQGEAEGAPKEAAYQPNEKRHEEYMTGKPATAVLYGYNTPFRPNSMHQAWLDEIPAMLDTLAEEKGFANADALAADLAGVDAEALAAYTDLSNRGYIYFTELHYDVEPTTEAVEKWFADHEAEYAAEGITKDGEKSVNVRHILMVPAEPKKPTWAITGEEEVAQVAEDGTVTCSEDLWEKGRQNAEKLLKDWEKNWEHSEYTFANEAYHNSSDEGSRVNGGMYTGIRKGQLAPELEAWCFDDARQPGDTEILRTKWGWHVLYFSGTTEDWYARAEADYVQARDALLIAHSKSLNKMKVHYDAICLGTAQNTAGVTFAADLLYPDVAHERFPEVPLYLQQDYTGTMYGNFSIVTNGCGITTLAMLASYMSDDAQTPPKMCAEYGDYSFHNGTDGSLFVEAPPEMNFYLKTQIFNSFEAKEYLDAGHIVVVLQHKGYWTGGGHYLVVEKSLEDNLVQVRDSNIFNYGRLQRHKEDKFPWGTITPDGMSYWIYEPKTTTIPACWRCGDETGAGIPDGLLLQDYLCEKCNAATERRSHFLTLCAE